MLSNFLNLFVCSNIKKAVLDKSNTAFRDQPSTYFNHFLQRLITFSQCSSASTLAV